MTDGSTVDGWIKLASLFVNSGTLARPGQGLSAMVGVALRKAFAFFCFTAAICLGLVAIGMAIAPRIGATGAVAVDAALAAAMGLAAFPWTRRRSRIRASAAKGPPPTALLAEIMELLKREKGLSIVAGLLLGLIAGSSRK